MMSENENIIEQTGQVVQGELLRTMDVRGYLVFMTVAEGRVPYSALVRVARDVGLGRAYVPSLRDLSGSFTVARKRLDGMPMPILAELEGWDGQVKQTLRCKPLVGGATREYQVSIESEGRMRGKAHRELQNILRLHYEVPEDFSPTAWVRDYEDALWTDEEVIEPDPSAIRACVRMEPYWENESYDIEMVQRILNLMMDEFCTIATSIDDVALRYQYRRILTNGLRGIHFGAGKGVWFIPNEANLGVLDTLVNTSALFREFRSRNRTQNEEELMNYINPNTNKPYHHFRDRTNLRILGFVDEDRALEYLRDDLQSAVSQLIAEYQHDLVKVAEGFNEDKVDTFRDRLDVMRNRRTDTIERINAISPLVEGIDKGVLAFPDVTARFESRLSTISHVNNDVTNQLRDLMTLE